jgi:hypothetical protein
MATPADGLISSEIKPQDGYTLENDSADIVALID